MDIWIADARSGLLLDGRVADGRPCQALCGGFGRVYGAFGDRGSCFGKGEKLFDFSLPPGTNTLFAFGEHICALSGESDCVWAMCPRDGSLRLSAPAGSYPRHACVSPCGRYMAVAGGGAGEVVLLDRELMCIGRHRVAGAAVDVCFLPRSMAVLCAVGEERITARLMEIRGRGVMEEMDACPQAPCCLLALPGGRMLAGVHGQVRHLDVRGRTVGCTRCVYPSRMRMSRLGPVFSDGWRGGLYTLDGKKRGCAPEPEDFYIT